MKKVNLISVLSLLVLLTGCFNPPSPADDKHKQVIIDNTFQEGFICSPANGTRMDDKWVPDGRIMVDVDLTYGDRKQTPCWIVSQHGDIYSLNDKYNKIVGEKPLYENGTYTFFDESKKMAVNPSKGSLYLELNTSQEYTRPRRNQEEWCHILLNQGFNEAVSIKDCDTIDFTIDLLMKKFEDHMDGKAERDLHATQFLMYLIVKSEASADAGSFFWFGIPFFDNRYPSGLPESGLIDAGGAGATGKFIYGMNSVEYLPGGLKLNEKRSVSIELKQAIGRGLLKAQSMNFFTHSSLNDLTFQSMNIGFEIPGTYDCGIEISNFALTANYK